jgi:hypothetical protein
MTHQIKKHIKKSKLSTSYISTASGLSVYFAGKLINNQLFLLDFSTFCKKWVEDNENIVKEMKKSKKLDKDKK